MPEVNKIGSKKFGMRIKVFSLLLIILLLMIIGGCWSRKELNELAIVLAAGVDRTPDNQIQITLQLARPSALGGGAGEGGGGASLQQNIVWVVSEKGRTIIEAERKLNLKVPRRIYWGHNIVVVYGEKLAREGIRDVSNFFMRYAQPRETTWVLIAKGLASHVVDSHSEMEKTSGQSMGYLVRNKCIPSLMIKDFQGALSSQGTNPYAPIVELKRTGGPQGPGLEKERPKHLEVDVIGTGVFKDDRLMGWLDPHQTCGMLWLQDEMENTIITIPSPGQPDKLLSLEVVRANTRVEPEYDGKNIRFNVNITFEADLLEQQSTEDLTTPEKIRAVEMAAARDVFENSTAVMEKVQGEYGTDVFKFGEAFHRKYKEDWKGLKERWNDEFVKAEVSIMVEGHLRRTGVLTKRASVEER